MLKKFLLIISTIVSVIFIALYFSYDYWLEKELKYQLSEIINEDPNSLYRYNFKKLNIDLIDGSVDLTGISIEPKDVAFDSLLAEDNKVRFLLELHLSEIELLQFEIREFINTGRIVVQEIRLIKPRFSYYFNPQ